MITIKRRYKRGFSYKVKSCTTGYKQNLIDAHIRIKSLRNKFDNHCKQIKKSIKAVMT